MRKGNLIWLASNINGFTAIKQKTKSFSIWINDSMTFKRRYGWDAFLFNIDGLISAIFILILQNFDRISIVLYLLFSYWWYETSTVNHFHCTAECRPPNFIVSKHWSRRRFTELSLYVLTVQNDTVFKASLQWTKVKVIYNVIA